MPSLSARKSQRLLAAVLTAALGVLVALPVLAQGAGGPDLGLGYATAIGLTTADIRTTISRIISYFLGLLGIIAVCIMLYAGFLWMTAGGNEEKVQTAKKWMINGVIGLVIIMSAFAITQFVFRAVVGDSQGTAGGGCPPGQVCGGGGGFGGGGLGGFKITGITPAGPGPGNNGWPKNYAFSTYFNATLATVTPVPPSWVTVSKCNARLDGNGQAQPFDASACATVVDGDRSISGNKLIFKPNPDPPGDFEGDFWYVIRVQGGAVKDQNGRTLLCPFTPPGPGGDISSPQAQGDLCDRAVALNDLRDVAPPSVSIDAPKSPPAYCGSVPVQAYAVAQDDFLVAGVDFLLDGGTSKLIDVNGDPLSNSVNAGLASPFSANTVYVDIATLAPGTHKITAIAQDGVPQSSAASEKDFTLNPAHCCNATKDDADGETGLDCGGACGSCDGSSCTGDADCASGFCDPATNTCQQVPVIDGVSPMAAGTGTLITINGRFFGSSPGSVVFLGGPGDADDVVAQACSSSAWTDTQTVVAVPQGAVPGPLRLTAAYGQSDQTDDARGPNLGSFTVNADVLPGICYLSPDEGTAGSQFDINGAGFGAAIGASTVALGNYAPTVAVGGWTDAKVSVIVPPAPEKLYPISITVNGKQTNKVNYLVRGSLLAGTPRIVAVSPESGPVGTYVTIQGGGFGSLKGTVKFKFGADTATGEDPICADNWHDNYVIVKVPKEYLQGAGPLNFGSLPGISHKVQIVTAPPAKSSNDDVVFRVTNEPLRPGICAVVPDNGRPGKVVQITGEGFGNTSSFGPMSAPRNSVEFFKSRNLRCLNNPGVSCSTLGAICSTPADGVCAPATVASTAYSTWSENLIGTVVAGDYLVKTTWPVTGPVYVVANNQLSSNSVPFTVGDCNEAGATCPVGKTCCATGSCQDSCAPAPRVSAYGWLFSTNVLPELPVVVEHPLCMNDPLPAILQSPSPYKDSTDACKNAEVRVEFSADMQMDAGSLLSAVSMQECGSGATPVCGTPVASLQFAPRDCSNAPTNDRCKVLTFIPPSNYNNGTPYLKASTWYRVTLKSDPSGGVGLKEPGAGGRYLDGDLDRKIGGDYVFTFRVDASDRACALANVFVEAPQKTIDQDTDPVNFQSLPTGANCNSLQCGPSLYTLNWAADALFLDLSNPAPPTPPNPDSSFCTKPVLAKLETLHTPLRATMAPIGTSLSKTGESDVTVKFAEPHVVEVTPVAECTQACINAAIIARFNVPMDPASLAKPGNVELLRCRNASCTAPFLPLDGTVRTVDAEPPDEVLGNGTKIYKHVALRGNAPAAHLKPSMFYVVRIRGGADGVKSRSGVPLAGLNDGNFYRWKFRTKDDPTACLASRATVSPSESTLLYVGEKRDLTAKAFGSPDECSRAGQELLADSYSWTWTFADPNLVLGGFIDGKASTAVAPSPPQTVVNTNSLSKTGCTAQCLLRGSQNALPQCGDNVVDPTYEQCDPAGANCSQNCLFTGTKAPVCGNGSVDVGETCDKAMRCVGGTNVDRSCAAPSDCPGGSCDSVFPSGCKDPAVHVDGFADDYGCVDTGSSTAKNSTCGDGFVSDGEACDDSNQSNGDGCSSDCLKEGTLKSCLGAQPGEQCINICGNGRAEPGEDTDCEKAPSPGANGCDPSTCLKNGLQKCATPTGTLCCGNGTTDPGEDALCESGDPEASKFCTARCLLKGSSPFYPSPSFCGDNVVGKGERAECEQAPDSNIDQYQVSVAEPQPGFDAKNAAGSMTTVIASTTGIEPADAGKAKVSLSCTCKTKPQGTEDAFCQTYSADLACADNGCCAPRPKVVPPIVPPDMRNDACRNSAIRISFDQLMNGNSLQENILVGYDNGVAPCPAGSTKIALSPESSAVGGKTGSFWGLIWNAVGDFFREHVFKPVFGAAAGLPDPTHNFCTVKAAVEPVNMGEPATVTVAHVNVERALPANKWIVIRVLPGAKALSGVALGGNGFTSHIGTSDQICTVSHVYITPASALFSSINQAPEALTAHAYSTSDQEIVPTVEYEWMWDWTPQPSTSSVVLDPVIVNGKQTDIANARVRGSRSDLDGGFLPKNGEAVVEGAAIASPFACVGGSKAGSACKIDADCTGGGSCRGVRYSGTAQVTVLLCDNPWPDRRICTGNSFSLPWDASPVPNTCAQGARFWYPFYDPNTNFKFYYCRDGKGQGDSAPALPALRETPVVIQPGRDILKEYLFTYDTAAFPANGAGWEKDAIGLRISFNSDHYGIGTWYANKGFSGSPTALTVDGYDAIKDGRTVYVDAAAMTKAGPKFNLYTNINTLSYTDGAKPETLNVFNQLIEHIDFNRNPELQDKFVCRDAPGGNVVRCNVDQDCRVNSSGTPVAGLGEYTCDAVKGICLDKDKKSAPNVGIARTCIDDLQCQTGADGAPIKNLNGDPARVGFVCDVPKQKLVRDVRRWSDFQGMRGHFLTQRAAIALPKLDAGTFLVTLSNSTWPSWTTALGAGSPLPVDPVNKHGWCADLNVNRSGVTCWSDQSRDYVCPKQSHVYQYEYFQETKGPNFRLRTDFENGSDSTKVWAGKTCPELSLADCAANNDCMVEGGACNFKVGKLYIGGVNPTTAQCIGTKLSSGGICGDGLVNPAASEICEPGQEQASTCDDTGRTGFIAQTCQTDCKGWVNKADAKCETGKCGDGVIQAPETCDDGSLNGKYSHCNATCTGRDFSCGDGKRQPNEACDCKELNGQYFFNGITGTAPQYGLGGPVCGAPPSSTATCSWDCSGPGPRCGDGVVNGTETCDGGFQEFKGYCNDPKKTGCSVTADCPATFTCGNFCPRPEQMQHRACVSNDSASTGDDAAACNWGTWVCTAPGFCGNGKVEVGEQCDDGNTNNTDGCVIDPAKGVMCKRSTCGDGYVNPFAGEQCDEGANNNRVCVPKYGLNCTYCQSSCKTATISGGYCGDNIVQAPGGTPSGPEQCEGLQGLKANEWICVSTRPEHQSYGKLTADASCSKKNCLRTCDVPDSRVCPQPAGSTNNSREVSPDPLKDVCDPDKDNDGVPPPLDCDDNDPVVHPAYRLDYIDEANVPKSISIDAAPMKCNGKDNACNGLVNQFYMLTGRVINVKNGRPLPNVPFNIWCGTKKFGDLTDGNGRFNLTMIGDGTCDRFVVSAEQNNDFCVDPDDSKTIFLNTLTKCVEKDVGDVFMTPRPGGPGNPGARLTAFLTWSDGPGAPVPDDLDLEVSTAAHGPYNCNAGTEPGDLCWDAACSNNPGICPRFHGVELDHDNWGQSPPADRNETNTWYESYPGEVQKVYVHNFTHQDGSSGSGVAGSQPDKDFNNWGDRSKIRVRMFDTQCNKKLWRIPGGGAGEFWHVFNIRDGAIIAGGPGDGGPGIGLTNTRPMQSNNP